MGFQDFHLHELLRLDRQAQILDLDFHNVPSSLESGLSLYQLQYVLCPVVLHVNKVDICVQKY